VPRPAQGDLVKEFNDATTLYGEQLVVEAAADPDGLTAETWREQIYDSETERERHAIQQRAWRRGRGEETPADLRAEHLWEIENRRG
jgi:hypothetical protein